MIGCLSEASDGKLRFLFGGRNLALPCSVEIQKKGGRGRPFLAQFGQNQRGLDELLLELLELLFVLLVWFEPPLLDEAPPNEVLPTLTGALSEVDELRIFELFELFEFDPLLLPPPLLEFMFDPLFELLDEWVKVGLAERPPWCTRPTRLLL
jgi:hypothetical protein